MAVCISADASPQPVAQPSRIHYNRGMTPDDKICYCYNVSLRKLYNYARREQPRRASQLSNCLGAGTGCGWCIPILKRIHESATGEQPDAFSLDMTPEEYAEKRKEYIASGEPKNEF
jgi:NAD(P)H-nitrite reductase large subunit